MTFEQFQTRLHLVEDEYNLSPEEAKDVLVLVDLIEKIQEHNLRND